MELPSDQHDATSLLLERIQKGDERAVDQLLSQHRDRIRRMIASRLDPKLSVRVDPSDIVQDTMVCAAGNLSDYVRNPAIAFYPWLRNIAWQRLVKEYRRHVQSHNRSVIREVNLNVDLPDESHELMLDQFTSSLTTPSGKMMRQESKERMKRAMAELDANHREVLVLRYLEQMSMREIADTLGIREDAARKRHSRALVMLQRRLTPGDESP